MILLDEIEKAHRDVFNILLQVLDDGRLSDNQGHTVDFTNTIIVMTSNIGSQLIQEIAKRRRQRGGDARGGDGDAANPLPARVPQPHRRDHHLPSARAASRSARSSSLQIARLRKQLDEKGIDLDVTDAALDAIAAEGYDPTYGARPLKRVIQQRIQNPLAVELLKQEFAEGSRVKIDYARRGVYVRAGGVAAQADR